MSLPSNHQHGNPQNGDSFPREPLAREPLHQPPNPDDLRRVPPATPACAEVRGMLRDFVDGDLTSEQVRHVEEHASCCRTCSIELARSEHEVLRLRSFFAVSAVREKAAPALRPDFAARLVERLVLDETSMVSAEAVARAVAAADAEREREQQEREQLEREQLEHGQQAAAGSIARRMGVAMAASDSLRGARVGPGVALFGAVVLLCVLVLVGGLLHDVATPQPVARLVVLEAASAFDLVGRPLAAGSGVGERQSLHVGPGGGARIDWHDLAAGPQPAATLQVRGEGLVRMQGGAPLLVNGRIDVATHRPVSIPLADGSQIDFGIGDYTVLAEVAGESFPDDPLPQGEGSLQDAPADLRVRVEVLSGAPATVVRATFGPTLVAAGQVGVYRPGAPVAVTSGGIAAAPPEAPPRSAPPTGGLSDQALLIGHVHERSGSPSSGAQIYFQFASAGSVQSGARVTGADGQFLVASDNTVDSDFAIVLALPAEIRRELGMLLPDAVQVVKNGNATQFATPLVFDFAAAVEGQVVDDLQQPRNDVQVVPCVVDELFAGLMPLDGARAVTAVDGRFRIERLPARLPPHQCLVLVFVREGLEPLMRAVPARGGVLANEPLGTVTMRRLRTIQLEGLFGSGSHVEILETVDAADNLLPDGSCLRRRIVHPNSQGKVPSYQAGFGRLWRRVGNGQPQYIQEMRLESIGGVPEFEPDGPIRLFSDVFRSVQPLVGTNLEMVSVYRHQRFQVVPPVDPAQSQVLRVRDSLFRAVAGAQVFAVDQAGGPGRAEVRFLGFTSPIGVLSLEPVRDDGDLVVLAPDGSVAFVAEPQQSGPQVIATVQATGRVLLHENLRPTDGSHSVMVKFERLDDTLNGLRPYAVRFASDLNGWEFTDLPPGVYRAFAHNQVHTLTVPPVGFVVLD